MGKHQRTLIVGALILAIGLASVGVAAAGVSSGGYSFARQHCSGDAEDSDHPAHVEPGCHSAALSLEDGHGTEGLGAGTQQTADGDNPSEVSVVGSPLAMDPTSGASAYLGADDNLDSGEHDSSAVLGDGPSDGGAVVFAADPAASAAWIDAIRAGDAGYLLTHPAPFLHGGTGACADGICASVQTQQALAYQGGDPAHQRDVANYQGQAWDPETCAGPSDSVADCGHDGIGFWHRRSPTTYVEPGLQVYEDPSPEGSPIGPYPLPAIAVTTCGVFIGGGPLQVPASPLTNSAGQLAIPTAC
jgi:hypothetical protein